MSKVIWGINAVLEALKTHPDLIEEIVIQKSELKGRLFQILERAKKEGISVKVYVREPFSPPKVPPQAHTQGVVAYLQEFPYASLEEIEKNYSLKGEPALLIALDEVEDPQNVGAILRVANAAGAHGLIIPKHRACEITGTVIKVSSGSAFNIPIAKVTNLKEALWYFSQRDVWIVGLSHRAEKTIYEFDAKVPLLLVAGNEERGIRSTVLERCDFTLKIPMRGKIESLNVAQAVGIFLYEVVRQRYFTS